jgi:hypothetical protein
MEHHSEPLAMKVGVPVEVMVLQLQWLVPAPALELQRLPVHG